MKKTISNFTQEVIKIVSKVPVGHILTYKQVAQMAGSPKAYRAVGNILNHNHDPKVPCHRVVRSDGKLGGYNKGVERKAELLRKENSILI